MREIYIKAIEKYIESKDMKNYLIENVDKLEKWQIIDLICGARADLKDKFEMLKKLADFETEEQASYRCSATNTAKKAKAALDELYLKSGEVFLKIEHAYDHDIKEQRIFGASPHFSLKPIMDCVTKKYSELDEEKKRKETYWYELEKYVPGVVDDMDMPCTYIIAPDGAIWFTDNVNFEHLDFASSQKLNLPVPFKVGDIITIDCTPFAPVKHGVITESGDNCNCCAVQCAWITDDGKIKIGALKHSAVFESKHFIEISPLYRAEVFTGELPEGEKELKEISEKLST